MYEHLTESLASSWCPNLPPPTPSSVSSISVLPGSRAKRLGFLLAICFHRTCGQSVNPTTSHYFCCYPRSNHCHLLGGFLQEPPAGCSVCVPASSHLSAWQTECIAVRVSCWSSPPSYSFKAQILIMPRQIPADLALFPPTPHVPMPSPAWPLNWSANNHMCSL